MLLVRQVLCPVITGRLIKGEMLCHCCTVLSDLCFSFSYEITLYTLESSLNSVDIVIIRLSIHTSITSFWRLRSNEVHNVALTELGSLLFISNILLITRYFIAMQSVTDTYYPFYKVTVYLYITLHITFPTWSHSINYIKYMIFKIL